jgi:hypothetical protein
VRRLLEHALTLYIPAPPPNRQPGRPSISLRPSRATHSGAFSRVHMAKSRHDPDDIVAIKCIDKEALRGKEDSLVNEIRVLRRLV